jgi:hypothetical protein
MKDHLKDFIQQHRDAFDDREPSSKVWNGIASSLRFSQQSWWNSVALWRAAAIVFMVLSGYLLVPKQTATQNALALKEFSDVETFYTQQISHKVDLIGEFKKSEGLNGFTHDFQQLEAMYLVLKEEMKSRPSQKVKDALVLNLLVRIDLLNQHLQTLEEKFKPRPDAERNS